MFQNFCHVFNFDCGFTHVSHIWPDAEFHEELLLQSDRISYHRVIDHFIKVCKGFACFLTESLFSRLVLTSPFSVSG